jgi:hypothetical protein
MATKFLHEAQRGASKGSIDLPLALLAGLSVGFVAFVMPADLLSRAVELSQLPSVLSAAEPPLGTKARAAFAVAASVATVVAVFLLLRVLGRKKVQPAVRDYAEPERDFDAPRLRRSDVHPDAPSRRPILAARELGEPAPARLPSPAPFPEPEDLAEEPKEQPAAQHEEAELELGGPGIEIMPPAPPEPVSVAPEPEPVIVATVAPEPPAGDASIAELMARLERGLVRRQQQVGAASAPATAAEATPRVAAHNDGGDDRLRSAIENLQKMAARAR